MTSTLHLLLNIYNIFQEALILESILCSPVCLHNLNQHPTIPYDIHQPSPPQIEVDTLAQELQLVSFAEPKPLRTSPYEYACNRFAHRHGQLGEEQWEEEQVPEEVLDKVKLNTCLLTCKVRLTCDVQTLLNTTNTTVCVNHANTKSSFVRPKTSPRPRERPI